MIRPNAQAVWPTAERLACAVFGVALASVLTVSAVAAGQPVVEHFSVDETFSEEICGVPVTTHVVERVAHVARTDRPFLDIHEGTVTFTGAGAAWVQLSFRGPTTVSETVNPDGILTAVVTDIGIPERIRTSADRGPIVFDRGRVERIYTVDLGDPANPEDDVVLSVEVTFVAGPHPDLESDFTLFCGTITTTLG